MVRRRSRCCRKRPRFGGKKVKVELRLKKRRADKFKGAWAGCWGLSEHLEWQPPLGFKRRLTCSLVSNHTRCVYTRRQKRSAGMAEGELRPKRAGVPSGLGPRALLSPFTGPTRCKARLGASGHQLVRRVPALGPGASLQGQARGCCGVAWEPPLPARRKKG